jgi:hypothetical protein
MIILFQIHKQLNCIEQDTWDIITFCAKQLTSFQQTLCNQWKHYGGIRLNDKLGVCSSSLPHVIFSLGTAPLYEPYEVVESEI